MSIHVVVTIMLCVLSCEPAEIRVWDGDSLRLGMTQESEAIRIFNIDAPEIEGQCAYESVLAQRSKHRLAELLQGQRVEVPAPRHGPLWPHACERERQRQGRRRHSRQ